MYRQNTMRMLGGLVWVIIPLIALMLFLPHQVEINYDMSILMLFGILLINFATMILPFRDGLLDKYFNPIMTAYSIILVGLICAGIYYTGGMRSPLFSFLLLMTAFCSGLFSSLYSDHHRGDLCHGLSGGGPGILTARLQGHPVTLNPAIFSCHGRPLY